MKQKKYLFYIAQNYSFAILRPIQKILKERGDKVAWFFEGDAINEEYLATDENRLFDIRQIIKYRPGAVLAPANSIPTFMPGLKVAVFHGFDAGKLDNKGRNDHFKIRGCFDLYCTQGPNTTIPFKKMQKKYGFFNVIETGWPTLDPLFGTPCPKLKKDRPVIFVGSTFSKRLTQAKYIFPEIKKLSRENHWKWIVSLHPKTDPEIVNLYKSIQNDNLTYVETDSMIPVLKEADIMIGDTSSSLTMFIIQGKPVITVNNIDPQPHFINITDSNELANAIETALNYADELMQEIKTYILKTHPYTDGESSNRVITAIDDVLAGAYPLNKNKPLNLLRNLKFRMRLKHWKM